MTLLIVFMLIVFGNVVLCEGQRKCYKVLTFKPKLSEITECVHCKADVKLFGKDIVRGELSPNSTVF